MTHAAITHNYYERLAFSPAMIRDAAEIREDFNELRDYLLGQACVRGQKKAAMSALLWVRTKMMEAGL